MKISEKDFKLQPIHCNYYDGYLLYNKLGGKTCGERTVYDYEIEYYTESEGGHEINGEFIPFESGSVNFRRPGQVVNGIRPFNCYILIIDIAGDERKEMGVHRYGSPEMMQPLYENELLSSIPNKISADKAISIGGIIKDIHHWYLVGDMLMMQSDIFRLFRHLGSVSTPNLAPKNYSVEIKDSIKYINEHFCHKIYLSDIAEAVHLSNAYFHKSFKESLGITPNDYILKLRMEKAKSLLRFVDIPIGVVSAQCGFFSKAYFCQVFKRETGMAPNKYRTSTN